MEHADLVAVRARCSTQDPRPSPAGVLFGIRPLPLIFFWIFWATRHPIFRYSKFTSRAGKGNLGNGLVF